MSAQVLPLFPEQDPRPRNYRNAKGASLENAFAEWMVKKLGYERAKRNEPINGEISERYYDVDIHAVKKKYEATDVPKYVIGVTGAAAAVAYLALEVAAVGVVGIGAAAYYFAQKHFESNTHAWVECKNQLGTVKRQQMQKFISSVEDVRANSNARWKPDEVMYVAVTGFDEDALNFAEAHNVQCYVPTKDGKGFEEVTKI
jgi:hypothetical protein